MYRIKLAFIILFLSAGGTAKAQVPELINDPDFRSVARQAVDSLYNMNSRSAENLLSPWKKRYPDHPLWTLFDGMELWWEILSDLENTAHDERFFALMSRADYEAGRLLRKRTDHADGLIIKAISNGYIARQHANREEWITAVNISRKALSAYQYLQQIQPDLPDLKLAEGLKLYYSAYIPEAYPIVRTVSWFLPDGDKKRGLELLKEAADQSIFAQAEATYFLGNIYLNYEKDYQEASSYLKRLYKQYPNNSYYVRVLVRSYFNMNGFGRALEIINESIARWERRSLKNRQVLLEEQLTWKGRILFRMRNYSESLTHLQKAFELGRKLPRTEHRSHHVIAGYYAGRSLLNLDRKDEASVYLKEIISMETEEHYRKAAKELMENQLVSY